MKNSVTALLRRPVVIVAALALTWIAREMDWIRLQAHYSWHDYTATTTATRPTVADFDRPARPTSPPLVDRDGLAIHAPAGDFGAAILALVPQLPGITGFVDLQCNPPSAWLPFWKRATVSARLVGVLELRRGEDRPPIVSVLKSELEVRWTTIGPMAQRSFARMLAEDLGTRIGEALAQEAANMRQR